jgi:hypothetical protein
MIGSKKIKSLQLADLFDLLIDCLKESGGGQNQGGNKYKIVEIT